jgi:molybdopterin molybdotransferase
MSAVPASVGLATSAAATGGAAAGASSASSSGSSASPALPKPGLMPMDEALATLLAHAHAGTPEHVNTLEAAGRVLAEDVVSTLNVPPMDNTSMDGYAVRSADCAGGAARLRIAQRIPAGHVGQPLQAGEAARIFTGAMVPPGADAVVMQEQCAVDAADPTHVQVRHAPAPGEWIRRAGEDIAHRATVLKAGTWLTAQALGLAASVGLPSLQVFPRVRVAAFFTGDELAMPGEPLKPGAIYNSNRFTLRALVEGLGCEYHDLGIVRDTLDDTRAALRQAAAVADIVITTGGVSVGEEDHVKAAVQAEGALNLWQIAMKPGKPLAYGSVRRASVSAVSNVAPSGNALSMGVSTVSLSPQSASKSSSGNASENSAHFIGLPGNPVSAFVTFLLFVRPFLLRCMGVADVAPAALSLRADFDWPKPDKRREFLRVRVNAAGGLDLFANQSSGVLTSTVWGDGVVDNPPQHAIKRGDTVRYLPFAALQGAGRYGA